jgi:Domain of unknown function (DUF1929).
VAATVDDPAALDTVSLIRPGTSTHSCDNEQRLVDVPFTVGSGTSVTLQLPADPAFAPQAGTWPSSSTPTGCRR